MNSSTWTAAPPPDTAPAGTDHSWSLRSPAQLTAARHEIAAWLPDADLPWGTDRDAVDVLALVVEELASNGLRHGGPPVELDLRVCASGWLVEVHDRAAGTAPRPPADRDPAFGGMGLNLVAELTTLHGWCPVGAARKTVWAAVGLR